MSFFRIIPLVVTAGTLVALPLPATAQRSSANYGMASEAIDLGGGTATAGPYSNQSSSAPFGSATQSGGANYVFQSGFFGQRTDVVQMLLSAPAADLDEETTLQLSAVATFDDATTLAVSAADTAWTIDSGPIASITPGGLATAGAVFANSPAMVSGTYLGVADDLDLTVLNSEPDNFQLYGSDGIEDGWQVQFFGIDSPDAAPGKDPDHDGQDNLFEWVAGLLPDDAASRFEINIAKDMSLPTTAEIIFTPRLPGRNYTIQKNPDLAPGNWSPLTGETVSDNGVERTVTDNNASGAAGYYKVDIDFPQP